MARGSSEGPETSRSLGALRFSRNQSAASKLIAGPRTSVLEGKNLRAALEDDHRDLYLSEDHLDALGHYAEDQIHGIVNDYLRERGADPTHSDDPQDKAEDIRLAKEYVRLLDDAFQTAPGLDRPCKVYRGVADRQFLLALGKGGKIDPGYLSTTIDKERSRSFAHQGMILELNVPEHTPMLAIHELVDVLPYAGEEEILLPRNGILDIHDIHQDQDLPLVRATYLSFG